MSYRRAERALRQSRHGVEDFTSKSQLMTYEGVRAMYRGLQPQQVRFDRRDPVDAEQRLAIDDLASCTTTICGRAADTSAPRKPWSRCIRCMATTITPIWLVSSQYEDAQGTEADRQGSEPGHDGEVLAGDVARCSRPTAPTRFLTLPEIDGLSPTYFLVLRLEDASGKVVGSNFYWLSTKPETLDWAKSNWYTTPTASYADFTALVAVAQSQAESQPTTPNARDEETP